MGAVADARNEDYRALEERAVASLSRVAEDLVEWVELVRDPEMPWAFRWAPALSVMATWRQPTPAPDWQASTAYEQLRSSALP